MKKQQLLINIEQAKINTANVNIDSIKINNKQMTLAVFRQLIRDDNITGPIWGQVNYHPDKCSDESYNHEHIHLIWQKEDTLRRATAYKRKYYKNKYIHLSEDVCDCYLSTRILLSKNAVEVNNDEWFKEWSKSVDQYEKRFHIKDINVDIYLCIKENIMEKYYHKYRYFRNRNYGSPKPLIDLQDECKNKNYYDCYNGKCNKFERNNLNVCKYKDTKHEYDNYKEGIEFKNRLVSISKNSKFGDSFQLVEDTINEIITDTANKIRQQCLYYDSLEKIQQLFIAL